MDNQNNQNENIDTAREWYETMINRFFLLTESEKRSYMRYFSNAPETIYFSIIKVKSQFYSSIMKRNFPQMEQYKQTPLYEYIVFILACQFVKEKNLENRAKARIREERLKMKIERQKEKKKKTLYQLIRPLYAEIQTYKNNNATWKDIVAILRKSHRSMFRDHKLTSSYVRRVFNQLDLMYKDKQDDR